MSSQVLTTGAKRSPSSPKGRYLITSRAFYPGQTIASFTSPLLALASSPDLLHVCSNCLSLPYREPDSRDQRQLALTPSSSTSSPQVPNSKPVKRCSGCRRLSYCSTQCQRADWKRVHRAECGILSRVAREQGASKMLPTPVRAALHVMLQWGKMKAMFDALDGHVHEFRQHAGQAWADISVQALAVTKYAQLDGRDGHGVDWWAEIVREVLCKAYVYRQIQTNAFHTLDADFGQNGVFLDVTLAMVNHSCTPNAFVYFFGRNAYLKAEMPIKQGDEVTISYTDYTHPKYHRHANLNSYHFICSCPRCTCDLDNYEVCKSSPTIKLNKFSLQPDLSKYKSPPSSKAVEKSQVLGIHKEFHAGESQDGTGTTPMSHVAAHWKKCKPLLETQLFALQPIPQILSETMIQCSRVGRYTHALCIAAFQATMVEPYLYPHPFAQIRLKTCLAIARLLVNIVFDESESPGAWFDAAIPFHSRLRSTFKTEIDPILLCQAMLITVVHYAGMAHHELWNVAMEAKRMLRQFEGRDDREQLTAGLLEWERDPSSQTGSGIFDFMIGKPLSLLAQFAIEVLEHELGKDFPSPSPGIR